MAGILTKGIKLSYKSGTGEFKVLKDLQEVPEIGNGAPEKIEVTTLDSEVKEYIAGLQDSGQDLAFKFLYVKEQFTELSGLDASQDWKVEMPDGVAATFKGTPSVRFDGASANGAITYTLNVTVESAIAFA
jgi:hypothetical protein